MIDHKTSLYHVCGNRTYHLLFDTVASQVFLEDGRDIETAIRELNLTPGEALDLAQKAEGLALENRAALALAQDQIDRNAQAMAEAEKEIADAGNALAEGLAGAGQAIAAANAAIDSLGRETAANSKGLEHLEAMTGDLAASLQNQAGEIEKAKAGMAGNAEEIAKAKAAIAENAGDIASAKELIAGQGQELAEARADIGQQAQELANARSDIAQNSQDIARNTERLTQAEADLARAAQNLEAATARLEAAIEAAASLAQTAQDTAEARVKKAGDMMTGGLTIEGFNKYLAIRNLVADGSAPELATNDWLAIKNAGNKHLAGICSLLEPDGSQSSRLYAYFNGKPNIYNSLQFNFTPEGAMSAYMSAPLTVAGALTAWTLLCARGKSGAQIQIIHDGINPGDDVKFIQRIIFKYASGSHQARLDCGVDGVGSSYANLIAFPHNASNNYGNTLGIYTRLDGTGYGICPQAPKDAQANEIVNAAWFRDNTPALLNDTGFLTIDAKNGVDDDRRSTSNGPFKTVAHALDCLHKYNHPSHRTGMIQLALVPYDDVVYEVPDIWHLPFQKGCELRIRSTEFEKKKVNINRIRVRGPYYVSAYHVNFVTDAGYPAINADYGATIAAYNCTFNAASDGQGGIWGAHGCSFHITHPTFIGDFKTRQCIGVENFCNVYLLGTWTFTDVTVNKIFYVCFKSIIWRNTATFSGTATGQKIYLLRDALAYLNGLPLSSWPGTGSNIDETSHYI